MSKIFRIFTATACLMLVLGCNGFASSAAAKEGSKSQYLIYENTRLGFTIQIPVSWKGYYIVRDFECMIEVAFVGKSEMSKNYSEEGKHIQGLEFFCIGNEDVIGDFVDSVKAIGIVDGQIIYSFTGTDFEIGGLDDDDPMIPKKERELMHEDLLKAKQMLNDVPQILKSFRAKKH